MQQVLSGAGLGAIMAVGGGLMAGYDQSNAMGKGIVWILFVGSIAAWCIMLGKGYELKNMARGGRGFLRIYRGGRQPLDALRRAGPGGGGPLGRIHAEACKAIEKLLRRKASASMPEEFGEEDMNLIRGVAERELARQLLKVESNMSFLATATTTAPFLGLLGTVWGVMDAFQAMSGKGVVLLAEVAPGISGALVTTVVGLLVALPSAIGYNYLAERVKALQVELENFVDEILADITHCYRRGGRDS